MELTAYTTFSDVRAIIGVTAEELPDTDLALEVYLFGLESELDGVSSTLNADFLVAAAAVVAGTDTTAQKVLYRATRLFATAQVASTAAQSLPLRAQKSITDGKASVSRFSDSPYKATLENLNKLLAQTKANLKEQYDIILGNGTVLNIPSFLGIVVPTIDPVVGE